MKTDPKTKRTLSSLPKRTLKDSLRGSSKDSLKVSLQDTSSKETFKESDSLSIPLTPKEKGVLEFIETCLGERGISPSYQEICDHFGLASFNSVQNYLKQLAAKGYISTSSHQRRAIRVLKSAHSVASELRSLQGSEAFRKAAHPTKAASRPARENSFFNSSGGSVSLPLLGSVAAGQPLEAMVHDEFLAVPTELLRTPDNSFALRVSGDSMIGEGIFDRDIVLVQSQDFAKSGDLVVAVVNGEATVKRFFPKGAEVELRPANPKLESFWYASDNVEVKGLVVGLMRRF